ncbi:MAG: hypothetical protein R3D55_27355 [Chloroflexota bacterium]
MLATPTVTAGQAQVDRNGNTVTFHRQNIEPNQTLVFEMAFAQGSLIATPPVWQARKKPSKCVGPCVDWSQFAAGGRRLTGPGGRGSGISPSW